MLKKLFRIEHLLFVIPWIPLPIQLVQLKKWSFISEQDYLRPLIYSYVVSSIGIGLLLAIPFVFYTLLRKLQLYVHAGIRWAHIIITTGLLLWSTFPYEVATSVVPGWHTTIFPPQFFSVFSVFTLPGLLLMTVQLLVCIYSARRILGAWRQQVNNVPSQV
jgi:hypothetical protein